jgi:hypothetical protein
MLNTEKLKELLVAPGHISESEFILASEEALKKRADIRDIFVEKNLIKDEQLGRLEAEALGYQFVILKNEKVNKKTIDLIPESVARYKGIIIISKNDELVKIGMTNPDDEEMKHLLEKKFKSKIDYSLITKLDCEAALSRYKSDLKEQFQAIIKEYEGQTGAEREENDNGHKNCGFVAN